MSTMKKSWGDDEAWEDEIPLGDLQQPVAPLPSLSSSSSSSSPAPARSGWRNSNNQKSGILTNNNDHDRRGDSRDDRDIRDSRQRRGHADPSQYQQHSDRSRGRQDRHDRHGRHDRHDRDGRDNYHSNNRDQSGYGQGYGGRRGGGERDGQYGGNNRNFRDSRDSRDNRRGGRRNRDLSIDPERETGIISVIMSDRDFAFIECADRDGKLFLHFSDFTDRNHEPRHGDEVAFNVVTDNRTGKKNAGQVEVLPAGTVAFEEVIQENVLGYISKPLSFPRSHSHRHRRGERDSRDRKEGYGGIITVTSEVEVETETQKQTQTQTSGVENVAVDADTTATPEAPTSDCKVAAEMDGKVKKIVAASYEFAERDLVEPRIKLAAGDRVRFNLFLEKRSGRKGATRVQFLGCDPLGRKQGVVSSVNNGFGFLKVEDNDDDEEESSLGERRGDRARGRGRGKDLYFHFNEAVMPGFSPTVGDELAFSSSMDKNGRPQACRLVLLPKGTIRRETQHSAVFRGVLEQEPVLVQSQQSQHGVRERISRRTEHHNFVNGFVRVQEVVSDEFEMAEKGANSSVSDSSDVVAARLFLGELVKVQGRDIETMGRNRESMFKEGSVRLIKGDTLTFSITYKLKPTLSSPSASSLVFADVRRCRATRVDLTTRSSSQRVQGQIIDIKDSSSRNGSRSRDGGNSGLFGFIHPLYPSKTGADADAPTGGATFGRGKGGKPSKLFFHLSEVMVSENSTNGNADTSADTVNVVDADVKKERTKAGNASVSSNAGEQSLDIRNDPSYANANRNISTSARRERVQVGDEVEFDITKDMGNKPFACRITLLPRGTLSFHDDIPGMQKGRVIRCRSFMGNEGRGRDRGRERGRGNRRQWLRTEGQDGGDQAAVTIRYEGELELQDEVKEESPVVEEEKERGTKADTETETEKGGDRKVTRKKRRKTRIPFSFSQTTPSTFPAELMAGDELVFKMRQHKQSKKLSVYEVRLVCMDAKEREQGVVVDAQEDFYRVRSASRKEILVFRNKDLLSSSTSLTSLKEGVGVRLGDCVEFNVSITERSVSQHHRSHHRSGHAQAQASKPSTTKLLYDAKRVKQLPPGSVAVEKVDPVRVRAVIRQLPTALTPPSSVQTHGRSGNGTRKREGKLVLMTSHGEEEDVSLRGNYAGDADAGQIKHGRGNGDNEMGGMSCVGDLEPGQRQGQGQNKELTVSDYTIFDACTQHPAFLLSIRGGNRGQNKGRKGRRGDHAQSHTPAHKYSAHLNHPASIAATPASSLVRSSDSAKAVMLKRQRQVVLSFGAKDVLLLNSGSNSGDVEAGSLSVSSPPSSLSVSSSPLYSQHVALKEGDVVEVSVCSLISDPSVKRAIRITPVPALALCVWAPSTSTFTSASSSTSPSSSSSPTSSSAAFAAVDDDARAKAGRLQLMQSKHAAKIHGQRTPSSKVADTVGTGTGAGTGEEEVLFYVDDVLDNTDQAYMLAEDEDQKKGGDKAVAEADSSDDSVDTDSDFESNKTVKTCKTRCQSVKLEGVRRLDVVEVARMQWVQVQTTSSRAQANAYFREQQRNQGRRGRGRGRERGNSVLTVQWQRRAVQVRVLVPSKARYISSASASTLAMASSSLPKLPSSMSLSNISRFATMPDEHSIGFTLKRQAQGGQEKEKAEVKEESGEKSGEVVTMVEDKSDTEIAVQVQVQAHVESRTGTTTEVLSQARVDEGVDMTEEREEKGM